MVLMMVLVTSCGPNGSVEKASDPRAGTTPAAPQADSEQQVTSDVEQTELDELRVFRKLGDVTARFSLLKYEFVQRQENAVVTIAAMG